jgi:hypothetical protein
MIKKIIFIFLLILVNCDLDLDSYKLADPNEEYTLEPIEIKVITSNILDEAIVWRVTYYLPKNSVYPKNILLDSKMLEIDAYLTSETFQYSKHTLCNSDNLLEQIDFDLVDESIYAVVLEGCSY